MSNRIPTKIMVTPLNEEEINLRLSRVADETTLVARHFAMVDTPQGAFIVDSEGVGLGPLAEDDLHKFYGFPARNVSQPPVTVSIAVQILRGDLTAEPVNLEAFIETGSPRLDRNYEAIRGAIQYAIYD